MVLGKVESDHVLAGLDFGDLAPGDHLHAACGFEERKDFDAEGREDQVGVFRATDGHADAKPGKRQRDDRPERVGQGGVRFAIKS